jgi:hypothetical protein
VLLALQLVALAHYYEDQQDLRSLMDRIAPASIPPSEQAKRIVAFLKTKPAEAGDSYFLLPIFRFLRPTARQVAEHGGDCADRSRLTIVLLAVRGTHASKWALYSPQMQPKHAVVELEAENGKMVVDPLFGLWFPKDKPGTYYGISDLKQHPSILRARVQYLLSRGEEYGAALLHTYPLDVYVYDHARTINWDKSPLMRLAYQMLVAMMGPSVDEIRRPTLAEQPALMVAAGIIPLELAVVTLWILTSRRERYKVVLQATAELSRRTA